MKAVRMLASAAFAFLMVACLVAAQDDGKDKKKKKGGNIPGTSGMVEKVDAEAKTITIKTGRRNDPDGKTVTMTVNDKTKYLTRTIESRGAEAKTEDAKFEDVKPGKRVVIQHTTKDGKEVASAVTILARRPQ